MGLQCSIVGGVKVGICISTFKKWLKLRFRFCIGADGRQAPTWSLIRTQFTLHHGIAIEGLPIQNVLFNR